MKLKIMISWLLTIIFAIVIIYECYNIFDNGNTTAGNIIALIVAFLLTFISSTMAKIYAKRK